MFVFLFLSKCRKKLAAFRIDIQKLSGGKTKLWLSYKGRSGLHTSTFVPQRRTLCTRIVVWTGVFLPEGFGSGQNTSTRQSEQVTPQSFCGQLRQANLSAAHRSCPHGSLPQTANTGRQRVLPFHHMGSVFENKFCVQAEGSDCCGSCSGGVERGKPEYACMHGAPWNENEHKDPLPWSCQGQKKSQEGGGGNRSGGLSSKGKEESGSGTGRETKRKGRGWPFLPKWWFLNTNLSLYTLKVSWFFFFCNLL